MNSLISPHLNEDLPILTDIVASPRQVIGDSKDLSPPVLPVSAYGKSAKIPLIRIQASTINFLQALKTKGASTKRHALPRSAYINENSPLEHAPPPTPPAGETRIAHVPFQAKIILSDSRDETSIPLLSGLFDENSARDQEKQIIRLAEERARLRAEQVVKEHWQAIRPSLIQELIQQLPQEILSSVKKPSTLNIQNALTTMKEPQITPSLDPLTYNISMTSPSAPYHPHFPPLLQETSIHESALVDSSIASSTNAPKSKY